MPRNKKKILTIEEFLQLRPRRGDFPWNKNQDGLVVIEVPKFYSRIGKSFCKLLKKENMFHAHLDSIGSVVWEYCDGEHTVGDILEILKEKFPEEGNLDQRLFLYLKQMEALKYLIL